jgi:tRNA threonylcarbamoyladenosine biosynthesis protein TsaB
MVSIITLAINTSVQPENVALLRGKNILEKVQWNGNRDETKKLLPAIVKLLKRADLRFSDIKGIQVAKGPGGFSALRIGVTVANVLALILKIPLFEMETGRRVKIAIPKYSLAPNITYAFRAP